MPIVENRAHSFRNPRDLRKVDRKLVSEGGTFVRERESRFPSATHTLDHCFASRANLSMIRVWGRVTGLEASKEAPSVKSSQIYRTPSTVLDCTILRHVRRASSPTRSTRIKPKGGLPSVDREEKAERHVYCIRYRTVSSGATPLSSSSSHRRSRMVLSVSPPLHL